MKTCPCGHRPEQHPPAGVLAAFRASPAPNAYSCTGPGCSCLMSAEQARESLVETLDVTSGQIEDKTMTDAPANLRELLDYWEARRQDAIQGRYSPEPNSGDHLGTYIKGLKRCSDDLERVIHRGPKPDPLPRFIVTTDSLKMVREALCVAQHGLGYLHDRNADRHRELLGRLIESIDQQRPLGPDGKHDHRHTPTCGCEDKA